MADPREGIRGALAPHAMCICQSWSLRYMRTLNNSGVAEYATRPKKERRSGERAHKNLKRYCYHLPISATNSRKDKGIQIYRTFSLPKTKINIKNGRIVPSSVDMVQ